MTDLREIADKKNSLRMSYSRRKTERASVPGKLKEGIIIALLVTMLLIVLMIVL